MNMQKTIMVRRANKLTKPIGKHYTIQKIINDGGKRYGFAIDDAGDTAFIPKPVVLKHQITEADEGAGFTAPTRDPASQIGRDGYPQIMLPLVWDGDAEEMAVEEDEPDRDYDAEIDKLVEMVEGAAKLAGAVDGLIQRAEHMEKEAANFREMATFIHNELTAIQDWVDVTYPAEENEQ